MAILDQHPQHMTNLNGPENTALLYSLLPVHSGPRDTFSLEACDDSVVTKTFEGFVNVLLSEGT